MDFGSTSNGLRIPNPIQVNISLQKTPIGRPKRSARLLQLNPWGNPEGSQRINMPLQNRSPMGAIGTCPCGWTLVSPQGVEDVKKHAMIHMKEVHPETVMTPEELMTHIKQF